MGLDSELHEKYEQIINKTSYMNQMQVLKAARVLTTQTEIEWN